MLQSMSILPSCEREIHRLHNNKAAQTEPLQRECAVHVVLRSLKQFNKLFLFNQLICLTFFHLCLVDFIQIYTTRLGHC